MKLSELFTSRFEMRTSANQSIRSQNGIARPHEAKYIFFFVFISIHFSLCTCTKYIF